MYVAVLSGTSPSAGPLFLRCSCSYSIEALTLGYKDLVPSHCSNELSESAFGIGEWLL